MGFRFGQWRPLGRQTEPVMKAHDVLCLHTMVGTLEGTDRMFQESGYGGTESHFGVGGRGLCYQWQDTDHQADANLDGNPRVLSVETADWGEDPFVRWDTRDPSRVPAWTPEQVRVLAHLCVLAHHTYGIPLELIADSRPGRRGIGYHRQGCDPWRVRGGERWSTKPGKVCPGDRRIAQIPEVIAAARAQLARPPVAAPAPTQEDTMQPITLTFYDEDGHVDPDGLAFRGAAPVEAGPSALGRYRTWVRWGTYGEACTWAITFWGPRDSIGTVPGAGQRDNYECPAGCRGVTVEGRRSSPLVQPAAALIAAVSP